MKRHLAACGECRAAWEGFEETWRLLGRLPAPQPDSSAMRTRFGTVLEAQVRQAPRAEASTWFAGWRIWRDGARLAAAAVLVLVGVAVGRSTAPAPAPAAPELDAVRAELREMRVMVGLSLMQQPSASERLKGVSWSGRIDQPGNELVAALLETLMHDPNDNVRLATVDALKRFADRDVVRRGAVEALPRQTSPLVQVALIDFVLETNARDAAQTLRRLSSDTTVNEAVRARAALAAERLG